MNISNLITAQKESLPNITGYALIRLGSTAGVQATLHIAGRGGALTATSDARNEITALSGATSASKTENHILNIDASQTTGTGSGVYQNDAHVQPNTITIKHYLRLA